MRSSALLSLVVLFAALLFTPTVQGTAAAAPTPGSCCACVVVQGPQGPAWACPCTFEEGGYECVIRPVSCTANGICVP